MTLFPLGAQIAKTSSKIVGQHKRKGPLKGYIGPCDPFKGIYRPLWWGERWVIVGFWGPETLFEHFWCISVPRASYKGNTKMCHTRAPRRIDPHIAEAPKDFLYGASRHFLALVNFADTLRFCVCLFFLLFLFFGGETPFFEHW